MKKLFLFLLVLGSAVCAAAQEQRVAGFVFIRGTMNAMPFASVWLLDPQTEEPEYAALTSVNGWYELGNVAMDRVYILKVTAPGCETLTKKIRPRYNPRIQWNYPYHIALERSADAGMLMPVATYDPKTIAPDAVTVEDIYGHIPGIIYEDGFFTDEDGANIRIVFSGYITDSAGYAEVCNLATAQDIISIDYYDLSNTDSPCYDGILDFRMKIGVNAPAITEPVVEEIVWDI